MKTMNEVTNNSGYEQLRQIFQQFNNFYHTLKDISKSNDEKNKTCLCDSLLRAYNFDAIIQKQARRHGGQPFCTVDAISFKDEFVNFIEFKNSKMSDKEKYILYLKIAESYRYFEKILLESEYLDKLHIRTRFVFVYDAETLGNGTESFRKIDSSIQNLANPQNKSKDSSIENKLRRVFVVCHWLEYFDEIEFLEANEFLSHASLYCNDKRKA